MEKSPLSYRENHWDRETVVEHVIEDIVDRLRPILKRIKEDVEHNKIGMVLGIDASGRVPALLLAQTLKYKTNIEIRFVAGNNNVDNEEKEERLRDLTAHFATSEFQSELQNREVLIIDDIIASGYSIAETCEALQRNNIVYRVVALALEDSQLSDDKEDIEEFLRTSVLVGETNTPLDAYLPEIYGKYQMSGVKKGVGMISKSIAKTASDAKQNNAIVPVEQNTAVLQRTRELLKEKAGLLARELGWI